MTAHHPAPEWCVLLLGGASGTGKSSLSYPLARRLGVPVLEIDDIVEALLATTTPEQQPALHYWTTRPEAATVSPDEALTRHLATCDALVPAIEAVIANHLETAMPVVVDGDQMTPELAARLKFRGQRADGRVRAVFLTEPDEDQVTANYRARERSEQRLRAQVSVQHDAWLTGEAARYGVPVLAARPHATALARLWTAFGLPDPPP
ncbi:AAA family ATPase [Yinghuangia soli]|uniref:AAA family ATPase n=1 Tax=Yinghuangia soli TaxID=2908204 RepID=A0AA41PY68_9ACTN|nr:AAA family ATPase [Yinghuangia soli]MCF2527782.1 AAA family ATPase [Yinghuangia soli]